MKRFLLFVAVATLFAACSKDGVNEISNDRGHAIPSVLYASIDTEDETRIQLNELQKTVWTEGDLVSVFYYCNGNTPFEFKGKTGDRDGRLGVLSLVEGNTEIDKIVSIYPYSEEYTMNTTKKYVSVKLPATQHYLEGSYGVGDNLMAYVGDDDSNLSHKNLCGWIKIQLKGSGIVTKITLKGNDGEQLAGDAKFYYEDFRLETLDQGGLAIGEYIETITLDCGKGVTLDAETPTEFYFVVAPHTFAKGITIEATCSDGTVMTKSTSNKLTVERNHIKPMAALPVDATILANNKIWYTNGSTTEPTAPYKPQNFGGATIQSNLYDAEKECWVITFDKEVTEIGNYAFSSCKSLTSVTIGDSVTTIGKNAFYSCESLTSVTIPNSVTTIGNEAFYNCSSLTSVTIPDSVTTIGNEAFYNCSSLTSVTIPDSVMTIRERTFYGCSSLTSVTIPDSVTTIGEQAFYNCHSLTSVTIPDSVTTIGNGAFSVCTSLKEFKGKFAADGGRCLIIDGVLNAFALGCGATQYTIPNSVTTIGRYAFRDCDSLTSVTIPNSVTTIGDGAFIYCGSLTSVTIPNSVTTIGDYAFCYCTSLTSVTIPDSVTTIGNYAFSWCDSLTSVTIPDSVTTIGEQAFYNCYSLTSVTIGKGVTTIGKDTFSKCSSLTSVTIPDSVTTIGDYAFYYCTSLTSVTIPDGVMTIGYAAFYYCKSLTSVTIPDSVTTIGEKSFYYCTSLKAVYCKPTTPPTGGDRMFDYNASGRKIYVPASDDNSIINAYKAKEYWSDYKDYIFEDEPKPANNEIWYTNGSTTAPTAPNDPAAFGDATIQSNTYDVEKECWIITFDKEVTEIGWAAFQYCGSLISVTIPDSVTTIGEYAFCECTSLTSVTIPNSVTTIGGSAFCYCESLTSVTIPDDVTTIGIRAFEYCTSLASVTIGDGVTTIGKAVFCGCDSLKEFKGKFAADGGRCLIKDNTIIAYANASGTTYTIPDDVTTIGSCAFDSCTSLTSVTISNSVTTIENYAFYGCSKLTSVTIGDSVTTIEKQAFYYCTSLKAVYCKPTTPPTGGDRMFDYNASGRKIYVPASDDNSIINAYKAKQYWRDYKNYISESSSL